ncbi:integrase, catalytic region, zinc finger, CCHC-type containing protein [Tanacetum coccineum]
MELMNLILLSIPNDIYNSVDACTLAKDMWKRVEHLMRETIQNKVDRETRFTNDFDQFVAEPGEALVSFYNRFAQLMNDLERNDMHFPILEKSHDPLALAAHTGSTSRNTSSYYVTHPTAMVDYEDEYQQDDVHTNSEDPLASAMLLLTRAITQNFSTPTNNRLRTSSNTRNQAIIQGDKVNIQIRNSGNVGRNNRRAYDQEEIVLGSNAPNETVNVQRTIRTPSLGNTSTVQCYNCNGKGHYARNCPKPRVRDSKYFMEQMLLAKQDEARVILTDEIQPADNTSNAGPSYDSAFISEVQSSSNTENEEQMYPTQTKIINSTIRDDQIDSDIIFDSPNRNVNSGSIEKDTHVHDLYLEAKLKKNVDLILKLGNSLQGMFMLRPKPLSVYDQQLKHGNLEISLNVRDNEDTLDDASKSQQKVYEKMNDPIAVANKQNCWTIDYAQINALYKDFVPQKELSAEQKYFPSSFIPSDKNSNATPSIPASMPSESPLIIELDKIKNCFQRLSELIQKNCKRASIFYTSPEEIQLNDFCQDQLKPIVNELQFYFEFFKTLFQRDIKEMKDVFESTETELCELEKQNDFLKDQLMEESIKHEVELSVLLNHKCVDNSLHAEIEQLKKKSIEIQEGLQARIKILEKDVQRCEKQSVDFELKLQHEKEKHKWDSSFQNKNTNPLDYSWISKIEKLEDKNLSLDFMVQSLIKERDNVKLEY